MKTLLILFVSCVLLTSCNGVSDKTKDAINKGGETVGKTATEFIEGVTKGVDKTLQCKIKFSPLLTSKGLHTGKFSIENGPNGGSNNCFRLYLIFDKDYSGQLQVKACDKDGLEFGRTKQKISAKAGDASYFDFVFDPRSSIEVKSTIEISE
jgi:predicted small secreted protein